MPMSQDEILEKVREVLVDALGVDDEDVEMDAKLVQDLGAESIDFLDIQFQLEKVFGIKIEQRELFPDNVLSDSNYVVDGKVTDAGMARLREVMPHADLTEFDKSRNVDDFSEVFTVEAVVHFVDRKLKAKGDS